MICLPMLIQSLFFHLVCSCCSLTISPVDVVGHGGSAIPGGRLIIDAGMVADLRLSLLVSFEISVPYCFNGECRDFKDAENAALSGATVTLIVHGGALFAESSHTSPSGLKMTVLTKSGQHLMLHGMSTSLSIMLKLLPLLNGEICESSVSFNPRLRKRLLSFDFVVNLQSYIKHESIALLSNCSDPQRATLVGVQPLASSSLQHLINWQLSSSVFFNLSLYGDNGGVVGNIFPNPSFSSLLLVGPSGPYLVYGYWLIEVVLVLDGLKLLIIHLLNIARQYSMIEIAIINLTSSPMSHFSVKESLILSPLFQRATFLVRIISVQWFPYPLWSIQSSSYMALRAKGWICLQFATESSSPLSSGTFHRSTLELYLVAVIYLYVVFVMVIVVSFLFEDEDEFSLYCNETV